ncbi:MULTISPECIES: hypothetical protein [Sphingobacterium]|uniref:hypothetical protein n=1 Tax=Sphingobacterium TaxID=28453 RepID=UPI00257FAD95|nr:MULTISPECIES: hypothetical protein [Sphingobacterium]
MKATIQFNGKSAVIELTPDQLAHAKKQTSHFTNIKTLQDALDYVGETIDQFNHRTQFDDDAQKAGKELEVIVLAVRQGNILGHNQGDKWYFPLFYSKRSASGFSFDDCGYGHSRSCVGSRLCVESAEKAEYLGKQFADIYDRYLNANDLAIENQTSSSVEPKIFNSYKDIKTIDDACAALGIDLVIFLDGIKNLTPDTNAYEQLKVVVRALNGGEHMDYKDEDEYKYFPYFNSVGSASGFSFRDCGYGHSDSSVGSRLAYKSREIAEYAGKQFIGLYDQHING